MAIDRNNEYPALMSKISRAVINVGLFRAGSNRSAPTGTRRIRNIHINDQKQAGEKHLLFFAAMGYIYRTATNCVPTNELACSLWTNRKEMRGLCRGI